MTAFGSIVAYSHREHLILVDLNRGEPMARFHRKAEASFAHSKRFAHHDVAVHVVASMFARATEPRSSVWSARSLLPLWRVGRQRCSLRGSIPATQKVRRSPASHRPSRPRSWLDTERQLPYRGVGRAARVAQVDRA